MLAGVRQPADAERLRALSPNLEPVFLDVTVPEQIEAVVQALRNPEQRPAKQAAPTAQAA